MAQVVQGAKGPRHSLCSTLVLIPQCPLLNVPFPRVLSSRAPSSRPTARARPLAGVSLAEWLTQPQTHHCQSLLCSLRLLCRVPVHFFKSPSTSGYVAEPWMATLQGPAAFFHVRACKDALESGGFLVARGFVHSELDLYGFFYSLCSLVSWTVQFCTRPCPLWLPFQPESLPQQRRCCSSVSPDVLERRLLSSPCLVCQQAFRVVAGSGGFVRVLLSPLVLAAASAVVLVRLFQVSTCCHGTSSILEAAVAIVDVFVVVSILHLPALVAAVLLSVESFAIKLVHDLGSFYVASDAGDWEAGHCVPSMGAQATGRVDVPGRSAAASSSRKQHGLSPQTKRASPPV